MRYRSTTAKLRPVWPVICLLAAYLACQPAAADTQLARNQSLRYAIEELERNHGLTVYYSSDLVEGWMTAPREAGGETPPERLAALLAPYGLAIQHGPRGSYLIVREDGPPVASTGDILGIVKDKNSGRRISGAAVSLVGAEAATTTSTGGHFSFIGLSPGGYTVQVNETERAVITTYVTDVKPGKTAVALIDLEVPATRDLGTLVVSASRYSLDRDSSPSHTYLPMEKIEDLPDLGDDPLRAVARLPGTATGGVTAKSNVRGGEVDETLVQFDGLRLYNPFHLKDFQSVFSTIDPRIVSGMEVYTGGYPVTYGDRMSSVIDVASLDPFASPFTELALSFFNASAMSGGPLADGRGDWMVSARRGNLDLLLDAVDPDIGDPRYVDIYARAGYQVSDSLRVTANFLYFDDDISLSDADQEEHADANYRDEYYWLRLDHELAPGLAGHTILAHSRLTSDRDGYTEKDAVSVGWVEDDREFTIDSIQTALTWDATDRLRLGFGGEYRYQDGEYDYQDEVEFALIFLTPGASQEIEREQEYHLDPDGHQYAAFGTARFRLTDNLAADLGLRWDKQTLVSGNDEQISPRLSMMYALGDDTRLRASWGRFYQSQSIDELQIEDGVTTFFDAQRSEHTVLSLEHEFETGVDLRLEAYRKEMGKLRPRYENMLDPLVLLPELTPDRIRIDPGDAEARGFEIRLRQMRHHSLNWWMSYAWSSVEDQFDAKDIRRSWDQTHAVSTGLIWSPGRWTFSLAGQYHTGWPTTDVALLTTDPIATVINTETRNGSRLGRYRTIDARIAREMIFENSSATVFAEVTNLFNWNNDCCTEYDIDDEEEVTVLDLETVHYLPVFVSLGLVWRF